MLLIEYKGVTWQNVAAVSRKLIMDDTLTANFKTGRIIKDFLEHYMLYKGIIQTV
jgi:hypothetical protein